MYIRMLVVMAINLFAVRYVLCALGQEDYGIYNVVAGLVTLLQSVGMIISTSTQRFFSYAIGEQNYKKLEQIFSASINIYALFSIIFLVVAETLGLWFVNNYLVIPKTRLFEANILYQLSIFTFIITLFHSPFLSAIIAHEKMGVYAKISILDCVLKFIVAVCLSHLCMDRLITYGLCLLIIPVLILIIYIRKTKQFDECRYRRVKDKQIHKELLTFSGWTLFSSMASIGVNQVQTILINMFFGPIANAARAVSLQIGNAITTFSSSFIVAVRPPMIKSYAENNVKELNKLFSFSNKFILYTLLLISLPIIYEMDTILYLWLGIKDEQTIIFSQLIVVYSIILALNNPLSILVQATGKLKKYSIYVESVTLICPILTYVLFYIGLPAYYAYISMIVSIVIAHVVRILCVKSIYNDLDVQDYIKNFLLRSLIVTLISVIIVGIVHTYISHQYSRLLVVTITCLVIIPISIWMFGLTKAETSIIKEIGSKYLKKGLW